MSNKIHQDDLENPHDFTTNTISSGGNDPKIISEQGTTEALAADSCCSECCCACRKRSTKILWFLFAVALLLIVAAAVVVAVILTNKDDDNSSSVTCENPLSTPIKVNILSSTGSSRLNKSDQSPMLVFYPFGGERAEMIQLNSVPALGSSGSLGVTLPDRFKCGISKVLLQTRGKADPNESDGWLVTGLSIQLNSSGETFHANLSSSGKTGIWLDGKPYDDEYYYDGFPYCNGWMFDLIDGGFPQKFEHDGQPQGNQNSGNDKEESPSQSNVCKPSMAVCDSCFGFSACCSGVCVGYGNCIGSCM